MDDHNYFSKIKKRCTLKKKKQYPATKHSNLQGKGYFRNNYYGPQAFLISRYFTMILVHLSLIAAVCYFSVYKLIGWQISTCSNSTAETLEKGIKYPRN